MRIAVLRNWDQPEVARQWPSRPPAEFEDVVFDFGSTDGADFIAVLNGVAEDRWVDCAPDRIWAFIQEPPNPYYSAFHAGQQAFARIYTTDSHYPDARHVPFFGALQWHMGRSYDELAKAGYPEKTASLSWVTSNASRFDGHKLRMRFLRRLRQSGLEFSLYGRGFTPIEDKWDGIAPYRYSVAFENYADDLYWSEKLTDCFLGFTTPFYFGTSTIGKYFPKGSYIPIDPADPLVFDRMREKIDEGFHEKNLEALREARELCLNRYNTLFYIAREMRAWEPKEMRPRERILLHKLPPLAPSYSRWGLHLQQRWRRLRRRLGPAR